ncbi:hypothetical protein OGAPHI_002995 [Ogataea philodendri]|uniref:Uncharacterized protein n=1 Tax=Ogataea philodendri TaxID=1378263 RepID=A0A9P8P913_9ASCO|nr:uncharacterized protein OGAPHI_002995 [Ogataea philodendri]KAH3667346.1 hypothetical protein OGAPHI_002995 [Ogataea philodendri]
MVLMYDGCACESVSTNKLALVLILSPALFERVVIKDLKSVDIENTNGFVGLKVQALERLVDSVDNPVEQVVVQTFRHGISDGCGLNGVQWNMVHGSSSHSVRCLHGSLSDGLDEQLRVNLQQVCHEIRDSCVSNLGVSFGVLNKCDITGPQDGSQDSEHLVLFVLTESNGGHRSQSVFVVFQVVDGVDRCTSRGTGVNVLFRLLDTERLSIAVACTFGELVKDMEVSLIFNLAHHSLFFQQIIGDICTDWLERLVELNLEILSVSGRVVISKSLCTSKRLQQWVGGQHHVFNSLNMGGRLPLWNRFSRLSLMLWSLMVDKRVKSLTPTSFFLCESNWAFFTGAPLFLAGGAAPAVLDLAVFLLNTAISKRLQPVC